MLRRVAFAAAMALTSACAVHAAPAPVTAQQAAAIEASCTTIMGFRQGEYGYQACRDSLGATAAGLVEGQARLAAYDVCRGKGFAAGSAALATCMLDNEKAAPMPVSSVTDTSQAVALPHDDLRVGRSYYNVTHAVQWRREQYSCAQLGLVPGSTAFVHCVASLDADLLPDTP